MGLFDIDLNNSQPIDDSLLKKEIITNLLGLIKGFKFCSNIPIIIRMNGYEIESLDKRELEILKKYNTEFYPSHSFSYGSSNFTISLFSLFKEKSKYIIFVGADEMEESAVYPLWKDMILKAFKGETLMGPNSDRINFKRKTPILLCEKIPSFILEDSTLNYKVIGYGDMEIINQCLKKLGHGE